MITIGWKIMTSEELLSILDDYIKVAKCELNYNKDYELLIATLLSAQSTDKRVNEVTKILFKSYDSLEKLNNAEIKDIERIIHSVGTYKRKSYYIKELSRIILDDYNGIVPNNREYLETLPGVGRKTASVFLGEFYDIPNMPVDTHIFRVSKRLGITNNKDDIIKTEIKLKKYFKEEDWNRVHKKLVLFGRYTCKSVKPLCTNCPFNEYCKYKVR